jgi:hypothetical protein
MDIGQKPLEVGKCRLVPGLRCWSERGSSLIRTRYFRPVHSGHPSERTGLARKTKSVDVRPARPGEKVVTFIAGEGKETQSPRAEPGDMVVRNRCQVTGNEEFLVKAAKFSERYEGPLGPPDDAGWSTYRPRGNEMLYFLVQPSDGTFTFKAPWGELMIARPGDAIVRGPKDPKDTSRVAAAAFDCTSEIEELPKRQ